MNCEHCGKDLKCKECGAEALMLTDLFWDCECPENYIHPAFEDECSQCGALQENQPDSRMSEVIDMLYDVLYNRECDFSYVGSCFGL